LPIIKGFQIVNPLKQLAGQTAIYGLGTIVPRLLNYLLVPFYTRIMLQSEYGIVTELYAYMAFFLVLLLYGMETTFFRYAEKEQQPEKVYATSLLSILGTSVLFILLVMVFSDNFAMALSYDDKPVYIVLAALIVSIDAFTAIQFAYLRQQNRSIRFSAIKVTVVTLNILLNLYFIWFCEMVYEKNPDSPWLFLFEPGYRVEYVLISNLVASLSGILILLPTLFKTRITFDFNLLRRMLVYAFPLLIVGITGMINEVSDKIIFKFLVRVPENTADPQNYILAQLGVYGANFKLAVLMTIFIQMFRYAAEPFFFAQAKELNAKQVYADVMKYFVIFGLLIFLGVMLFLDVFKHFIGPEYWEGLHIVPIVLIANLFLGIFFNLSVWYKLNDLTRYGAMIAIGGSVITIGMNILLVPHLSYLGSALGHLGCYMFMMVVSYFIGRKFYPVPYDLRRISVYFVLALMLFLVFPIVSPAAPLARIMLSALLFIVFIAVVFYLEKPNRIKKAD
jgi:O-antigen/teichoic acid export membrane protein